jgi:hypothetical protein
VLHSFVTAIVLLALPASVAAQPERIAITASGEHRMAAGETAESARALALANAHRQAIATLANALPTRLDLTALKLSSDDVQAYVARRLTSPRHRRPRKHRRARRFVSP